MLWFLDVGIKSMAGNSCWWCRRCWWSLTFDLRRFFGGLSATFESEREKFFLQTVWFQNRAYLKRDWAMSAFNIPGIGGIGGMPGGAGGIGIWGDLLPWNFFCVKIQLKLRLDIRSGIFSILSFCFVSFTFIRKLDFDISKTQFLHQYLPWFPEQLQPKQVLR